MPIQRDPETGAAVRAPTARGAREHAAILGMPGAEGDTHPVALAYFVFLNVVSTEVTAKSALSSIVRNLESSTAVWILISPTWRSDRTAMAALKRRCGKSGLCCRSTTRASMKAVGICPALRRMKART